MKKSSNCLLMLLVIGISVNGCEKSKLDSLSNEGCEDAGKTVYEVLKETGRILYDKESNEHYLSYHVPETYDLVLTGIVCNMPAEFPQQDEPIEVIFSGVYKKRQNNPAKGILGYDIYYLKLTDIRLKQEK